MSYDNIVFIVIIFDNWRVTRSLVSYDVKVVPKISWTIYWRVTRSLVSYDPINCLSSEVSNIEGSPNRWWVTTYLLSLSVIEFSYWRVTRSLVSYDNIVFIVIIFDNWRVTRSLVSYDASVSLRQYSAENWRVTRSLVSYDDQYQPWILFINWRVTRSLVSYDYLGPCLWGQD